MLLKPGNLKRERWYFIHWFVYIFCVIVWEN